jgi:hypothetical protein
MHSKMKWIFLAVGAFLLAGLCPAPARAQHNMQSKEKPPMYSYVANWNVPRGMWKDMRSETAKNQAQMQKFLSDGDIVAFGNDTTLVHQEDEPTHDEWWSSMSWTGLMKVLTTDMASASVEAPVYAASKHHDDIFVSRYYNWHSGSFTNGFTRVSYFKLKADAPNDAVKQVSEKFLVPLFEKLLADGSIYEYEIDEQAIHTGPPNSFLIVFIANGAEGLDKWNAALDSAEQSAAFAGAAFDSWIDLPAHRDELAATSATYK